MFGPREPATSVQLEHRWHAARARARAAHSEKAVCGTYICPARTQHPEYFRKRRLLVGSQFTGIGGHAVSANAVISHIAATTELPSYQMCYVGAGTDGRCVEKRQTDNSCRYVDLLKLISSTNRSLLAARHYVRPLRTSFHALKLLMPSNIHF